jgi:hypothetical protein
MIQDGCRGSDSDIDYCGVYYVQGAPATSSPPTIITFECYWPETVWTSAADSGRKVTSSSLGGYAQTTVKRSVIPRARIVMEKIAEGIFDQRGSLTFR